MLKKEGGDGVRSVRDFSERLLPRSFVSGTLAINQNEVTNGIFKNIKHKLLIIFFSNNNNKNNGLCF